MDQHPYISHQTEIEAALRTVARAARLRPEEADEFYGYARLRLLENGCRILAAYSGTGSRQAYLAVVARRLLLDLRVREWGKWRPSAAARRAGSDAVRLERLVHRDGLPVREAEALIGVRSGDRGIAVAAPGTPSRRRRTLPLSAIEHLPCPRQTPAEAFETLRRAAEGRRLARVLRAAAGQLTRAEVEVLQRRFASPATLAQLARDRGVPPRVIYRQLEAAIRKLRQVAVSAGFGADAVDELLDDWAVDLPELPQAS